MASVSEGPFLVEAAAGVYQFQSAVLHDTKVKELICG